MSAHDAHETGDQANGDRRVRAAFARGLLAGALLAFAVAAALVVLFRTPRPQPFVVHAPPGAGSSAAPGGVGSTAQNIVVSVTGEVAQPGVYTLTVGARVGDALARAGGVLPGVDAGKFELARALNDGAHVYIPPVSALATSQPEAVNGVVDRALSVVIGGGINLNNATLSELMELPGIGATRAQAILDARPFASVDDLDRVPGIGSETLEKLRPFVTAP